MHGPGYFAIDRKLAREAGRLGGLAKVPKGFALDPERASRAGKIGGAKSDRTGIKAGQGKPRNRPSKRYYHPRKGPTILEKIINAEIEEARLEAERQQGT